MHLLYADESGSKIDPKQIFFVLAGVSVFERQVYWLTKEMDAIAERFNPLDPNSIELHASPMYHGKRSWRAFPRNDRIQAIKDVLELFARSAASNRMFACVVRKSVLGNKDPLEFCFEQIASRFDYYLQRLYKQNNDNQRGLMIFDKSTYETTLQGMTAGYKKTGHSWGVVKNIAEVPLFLDSKASRLIQLADIIAYSLFRHYEEKDDQFYSIISKRWDSHDGTMHGLYEKI